jgi:hypothetical protein
VNNIAAEQRALALLAACSSPEQRASHAMGKGLFVRGSEGGLYWFAHTTNEPVMMMQYDGRGQLIPAPRRLLFYQGVEA